VASFSCQISSVPPHGSIPPSLRNQSSNLGPFSSSQARFIKGCFEHEVLLGLNLMANSFGRVGHMA
jgi:hypothetical protein